MKAKAIRSWVYKNTWIWAFLGAVVIWFAISVMAGGLSIKTLFMNATLATFTFMLGISEMLVITSGNGAIDLSVTYTLTLSAYVAAAWFRDGRALYGILIIVGLCVLIGLFNGIINVYLRVHAMIGTLAVGYILFTVILLYSQHSTKAPSIQFSRFVQTQFGGFSLLTIFCILFVVLLSIVMYKTRFGKRLHALGQGHRAAYLSGIRVNKMLIVSFIASSLIAGLTGILLGAYVGGSYQSMGDTYQTPAIAAAMVGGTMVSGGKSSVLGTFFGAIMLTLLSTFLNLTGLSAGWQNVIEGVIIILLLLAAKPTKD